MNLHLQFIRRKAGMTQQEMADKLGLARNTISNWETGENIPTSANLAAFAAATGHRVAYRWIDIDTRQVIFMPLGGE